MTGDGQSEQGTQQTTASTEGQTTAAAPAPDAPPGAGAAPEDGDGARDKYQEALRRFSGDLRMVKQVFDSMEERGAEIREPHWRLLLQAHLDGRDLAGARDIMARMRTAGIEPAPQTQWDVAIALGRSGRTEQAMALVTQLERAGVHVAPERAPDTLGLFINAGEFGRSKQMLRRMADRGRAAQPAQYERLIEDCLRRQAINDTQDLVELMIDAGAPPDREQATELVAMMARAGHPDRAVTLRGTLAEAGIEIDPDASTEMLRAFAEDGNTDQAEAVLASMREAGQPITSFHANAMLTARLEADEHDEAWRAAMGLAGDGRIPTSRNLEGLLDASLESGNIARAGGAVDWMLLLGSPAPADRVGETVIRHVDDGQLDLGLELYRRAVAHGVTGDRRAARRLVDALVSADRLGEARGFLHELRKTGTITHGKHYGSLLAAYVRQGRFEEAVTLLQHMLLADITPTVADASRVVVALARQTADRARELLDELLEAGLELGEPTYRELMWAFARAGRAGPVREIIERMTEAGFEADDRHHKALQWASGETVRRLSDEQDEDAGQTAAQPGADEALAADGPPTREATVPDEPAAGQSGPGGAATTEATDEPDADQPGADQPGADQPGAEESGADESGADEPGADEPAADEPAAGPAEPAEDDPAAPSPPEPAPSPAEQALASLMGEGEPDSGATDADADAPPEVGQAGSSSEPGADTED